MRSLIAVAALQIVSVMPPPASNTLWLIGHDRTRSQTSAAFDRLPRWNRELVLPMLKPGDAVTVLFVDHEKDAAVTEPRNRVLDTRLRQFTADVLRLDDDAQQMTQASRSSETDLGVLFEDLFHSVEIDRQANVTRSYVLVALSDGRPDGPQSQPKRPRPKVADVDYRIVFLGVDEATESRLRTMAERAGFADPARMLIVPHVLVDQSRHAVQTFVGRSVNPALLQSLRRRTPVPDR